jgi:hypothetical protein
LWGGGGVRGKQFFWQKYVLVHFLQYIVHSFKTILAVDGRGYQWLGGVSGKQFFTGRGSVSWQKIVFSIIFLFVHFVQYIFSLVSTIFGTHPMHIIVRSKTGKHVAFQL